MIKKNLVLIWDSELLVDVQNLHRKLASDAANQHIKFIGTTPFIYQNISNNAI